MDIEKILAERAKEIDQIIERWIPRKYDRKSMEFTFGPARWQYNIEAANKAIADPIWDMLDRGGKRWRPTLFLLIAEALGADIEKLKDFVIIPEVVHNGTLLIDDIEDRGELRRGKPCTYKIFGIDIAVNAGNIMYYLPLLTLMKNRDRFPQDRILKAYEIYSQEMINIGLGQATDIAWHNGMANADTLTEDEYLQMCAYKTGTLARMSAKIAATLAGADDKTVEALGRFVEAIGVAFQIQDDVLSLSGGVFAERKGVGDDITEGKRSLPVIYTLQVANQADRKRLLEILNMHTRDSKLIEEAIAIIHKYGSVEKAKQKARELVKSAWADVEKLLPASNAKTNIKAFADFLIERKI
ncbi:MAG: polyprenyl synthetase family protein [Candidatus Aenigmarchaeota archaeon]|nr:polyprenyl synthetase family protein [Candidatus Aenigmarchaeota archaeon]